MNNVMNSGETARTQKRPEPDTTGCVWPRRPEEGDKAKAAKQSKHVWQSVLKIAQREYQPLYLVGSWTIHQNCNHLPGKVILHTSIAMGKEQGGAVACACGGRLDLPQVFTTYFTSLCWACQFL